ncbi:hypothetical protein [Micromonospora sp. NPDC004704]
MSMVVVTAAVLAVATVTGGAAPAFAATATLSIFTGCQTDDGRYYDYVLRVQGTTRYYPDGMRVDVRLWGDDEWSDDLLGGPYSSYSESSGSFSTAVCMNSSTLNEDIGQDEIYAGVRVYDHAGVQRETAETNRIHNYF